MLLGLFWGGLFLARGVTGKTALVWMNINREKIEEQNSENSRKQEQVV